MQQQFARDAENYSKEELMDKYKISYNEVQYYIKKTGVLRYSSLKKLTKQKADYLKDNIEKDDKLISMVLDVPEYRVKIFKERLKK